MDIRECAAAVKASNIPSAFDPAAVLSLIGRVAGEEYVSRFVVVPEKPSAPGKDAFELSSHPGKTVIRASSGVAAASGFNWYLKYCCGCHYSLLGKQMHLPAADSLPAVDGVVKRESRFLYRYFLNYCTFSYTMAFWKWEKYEELIDWMAMSGINLALNIVGHEEVWRRTLRAAGYTEDEARGFIPGVAFMPWAWMGNLSRVGGPLPDWWFEERVTLADRINGRMRDLGIGILVPGYAGMVPNRFKEKFPDSNPVIQGNWGCLRRPDLLPADDPMFGVMADHFYRAQKELFGELHYFSADPFHEGGRSSGIDIAGYAKSVQQKMQQHFPHSVWVFQGWQNNPRREMLNAVQKRYALVTDLQSDTNDSEGFDDFADTPWVFGTVNNYGATRMIRGNFDLCITRPFARESKAGSAMVGIGMLMEGITCDQVLFEILSDLSFREEAPEREVWLKNYIERRYGEWNESAFEAWKILSSRVYKIKSEGPRESALCARPGLGVKTVSTWGSCEWGYERSDLVEAVGLLYRAYDRLSSNECYLFDLTDFARQALANFSWDYYRNLIDAYHKKDIPLIEHAAEAMKKLILTQERLVSTNKDMLVGTWIESAREMGRSEQDKDMFECCARTILTLWSVQGADQLRDYAHKEWGGMLSDFYLPRWERFGRELVKSVETGKPLQDIAWNNFDFAWTLKRDPYPAVPSGDLKAVLREIFERYFE